jgi:hypothetical protein
MIQTQGDVLIVSAGSCGMAEAWNPAANRDAARLWPSFNVIALGDDGALDVETLSFGYKGHSAGRFGRRELVRAQKQGAAWNVTPVALDPVSSVGPELTRNERRIEVNPSRNAARWDFECTRIVEGHDASPRRYVENIDGIAGSTLHIDGREPAPGTPTRLELGLGRETRYRLEGGLCRTIDESTKVYGPGASPFEWLGLMNRYACDEVVLSVSGLGASARSAFASTTDLGTGIEQPLPLQRTDGHLRATVANCPARTLLRIYFPLEAT